MNVSAQYGKVLFWLLIIVLLILLFYGFWMIAPMQKDRRCSNIVFEDDKGAYVCEIEVGKVKYLLSNMNIVVVSDND